MSRSWLAMALAAALVLPAIRAQADLVDEALLLLDSGQLEEAELIFEALAAEFPSAALPQYYLGIVASRSGDLSGAVLAFSRAAALEPEYPWVQANLGIALYRLGENERAEQHLLEALLQGPEDPDVLIHLGLIEDERGEYEVATQLFAQAAELDPELAALAWYHAAESQLALGRALAARGYLESALAAPGPANSRDAAEELLMELDAERSRARRWRVRAGIGLELDDNLTVPELDAATGQSDIAGVFDAGLTLDAWRGDRATLFVGYDFYQSVYRTLGALDFQNHAPSLALQGRLGSFFSRAEYRYSHENIGGEAFLRSHRGLLSVGKTFTPVWSGDVALELEGLRFPSAERRDATRIAGVVGQRVSVLGGRVVGSLDWRPEWQDAVAHSLDYFEHALQLSLDTEVPLGPRSLGASAFYRYQHRNYEGDHPSIGEPRRDRRHTAGVSLFYPITSHVDATADYLHIASGSNVPLLSYDENVLTIRLELWF